MLPLFLLPQVDNSVKGALVLVGLVLLQNVLSLVLTVRGYLRLHFCNTLLSWK